MKTPWMLTAFSFLLFAASPLMAAGDATQRVFDVNGGGALMLQVPGGWQEEIERGAGGSPAVVRFSMAGELVVMLTPISRADGLPAKGLEPDIIHGIVEESAAKIASSAVEEHVEVVPLGGGKTGFYLTVADRNMVGVSELPPGEYRYMTQGALRVGEVLCTFTILFNEKPAPGREHALEMLRTAEFGAGA